MTDTIVSDAMLATHLRGQLSRSLAAVMVVAGLVAGCGGQIPVPNGPPVEATPAASVPTPTPVMASLPSAAPTEAVAPTPSSGPTPTATPTPRPTVSPAVAARSQHCQGSAQRGSGQPVESSSRNWAGYIVSRTSSRVTCVEGEWVEPDVTCPAKGETHVAIWVGIDGLNGVAPLVQAGTSVNCLKGVAYHLAWHEIYPLEPEQYWAMLPQPGERIWAQVRYSGAGFSSTVANLTTGEAYSIRERVPKVHRSTAEWIVEAPSIHCPDPCTSARLAKFSPVTFSRAIATVGGHADGIIGPWDRERTQMLNGRVTSAAVGPLSTNGRQFTVRWRHQ